MPAEGTEPLIQEERSQIPSCLRSPISDLRFFLQPSLSTGSDLSMVLIFNGFHVGANHEFFHSFGVANIY